MTAERAAQGGTPRLSLSGLAKRFGKTIAVYPLDLEVAAGEILAVLGPGGSGKTTLLRMIAGLEAPTQGDVRLDGQDMTWAAPGKRDIAYVFQDPALYPHLSVLGNAAFPLEAQGLPAAEAERLAADRLRRLGLEAMANLRPKALSPGDLQRAALARALVRRPRAFLLDEPLGRVDGGLRDSARETLRALLAESGAAALVATHDQEEAMALADRVAVIKDGRILQVDAPRALYENPGNLFVADFVGSPGMNLVPALRRGEEVRLSGLGLAARVQDGDGAGRFGGPPRTEQAGHGSPPMQKGAAAPQCWLGVRPENVLLSDSGAPCRVERVETLGSHGLLTARLENGAGAVRAWLPAGVRFREGQTVGLTFLPSACRWFDGGSGESLPWKTLEVACLPTP